MSDNRIDKGRNFPPGSSATVYHDIDGNAVTLRKLIRLEPEWAHTRITQCEAAESRVIDLERQLAESRARVEELEAAQRWIPVSERLPDFDQYVEVFSNGVVQDHKWFIDMGSEDQWANDLVEYRERPDIQDSDMWRAIEPPEAPNE